MHDEIIRHSLKGTIGDNNIVLQRERLIHFVESQMRDEGCVPSLDLEPQFTLDFDPSTETYEFELTVYGIYIGKEQACETAGITSGTMKKKYTPQIKLNQF